MVFAQVDQVDAVVVVCAELADFPEDEGCDRGGPCVEVAVFVDAVAHLHHGLLVLPVDVPTPAKFEEDGLLAGLREVGDNMPEQRSQLLESFPPFFVADFEVFDDPVLFEDQVVLKAGAVEAVGCHPLDRKGVFVDDV